MLCFKGKIIMITGAAGGIGSVTANMFLRQGAKVVKCDYAYRAISHESIDFSVNPVEIHLDVTKKFQVFEVVDSIVEKLGKLDVVVNLAGILRSKPYLEVTEEEWDQMFAINLKGQFFVTQAAMRHMIKNKGGVFVNMASISGKVGGVMAAVDYSASKAGVICMTKSLAKYGAQYGIRANSIAPSGTETSMIDTYRKAWGEEYVKNIGDGAPLGRYAEPEEIANVILFLASDESSYITGACIDVNGGKLMI
jgi:NAD(P)-dependent dehydrogenase (short-subunit alcohol dehydrogenase family)